MLTINLFLIILADVFECYICFGFGITVQHGAWFVYVWLIIHRQECCFDEFKNETTRLNEVTVATEQRDEMYKRSHDVKNSG